MIYEFGVMSTRYKLESDNEDIAKMAMSMFFAQNIPVAIYIPKQAAFMPLEILQENESKLKDNEFKKKLNRVISSIKKIR